MQVSEQAILGMALSNMKLAPGEALLVLTDVPNLGQWAGEEAPLRELITRADFARHVYHVLKAGLPQNRVEFAAYYSTGMSGTEPPEHAAALLLEYDVSIIMTSYSISHTEAREAACRKGRRIASMPGIEADMFAADGPMAADYALVRSESERLAAIVTAGSRVRVETDAGTNLSFSIAGRKGEADTGIFAMPGEWGNLPGGEAYAAPVEGTANGVMVVQKGWYPDLTEDMTFTFEQGSVIKLEGGGFVGDYFRRLLFADNDHLHRRNCAELGIGTNPLAKRADNVLEAEKIKGTVHIAIGDSSHMGGTNVSDLHDDFVLQHPRLFIDDVLIPL